MNELKFQLYLELKLQILRNKDFRVINIVVVFRYSQDFYSIFYWKLLLVNFKINFLAMLPLTILNCINFIEYCGYILIT